jgi:predicted MFS family arabinose efflux permease
MTRSAKFATAALVVAFSVGVAIAHLATSALPFVVGSLMDGFKMSATGAGLVGFFQIGGLAGSMIIFSPAVHRFRPVGLCLFGAGTAACSNALIYTASSSLALICSLGAVVGIGCGLMLMAAVAAAAGAPRPDRIYAAGTSGTLLLIVPMLALLPVANRHVGPRGTFLAITLIVIVGSPFLLGLVARQSGTLRTNTQPASFPRPLPLLAVWSLLSFGTGAMWGFSERIGTSRGLPESTVGWVLSVSPYFGLIGTGLAGWCTGRFNRLGVLAVGFIGTGAACLTFTLSGSVLTFAIAALLYWVFTMFLYVVLLGTAAQLDATGRLGTLGTGCERLAFAISAPVGGLLVDLGSVTYVGAVSTAACSVVALLFLPALGRVLRASRMTRAASTTFDPLAVPPP